MRLAADQDDETTAWKRFPALVKRLLRQYLSAAHGTDPSVARGGATDCNVGREQTLPDLVYGLRAIAAGLAQALSAPDSTDTVAGASGAVAGVLGAYLVPTRG